MLSEYMKAFFLIFMAEMGDKTQILAMTFATRYPVKSVLAGVFLGALLNHGLAIALGSLMTRVVPLSVFQIAAGFAFCLFGLMSLRTQEKEDESDERQRSLGPLLTVALAFFIGELGDKTQLAAVTLAVASPHPAVILMGTVTGMVLVSSVGIFVGVKLGDRIPELYMKLSASAVFTVFGVAKLMEALPPAYKWISALLGLVYLAGVFRFIGSRAFRDFRAGRRVSAYGKAARILFAYRNSIVDDISGLCLGKQACRTCRGKACIIGYAKELLENARDGETLDGLYQWQGSLESLQKSFDEKKVLESYGKTLEIIRLHPDLLAPDNLVNRVRNALEWILLGKPLFFDGDFEAFMESLEEASPGMAERINIINK